MMTNLFSSFDPTTHFLSMNWMSSLLIFFIMPSTYWLMPSRLTMLMNNILMILHKEFKILIKSNSFNGSTIIFITLFMFIMFNNLMGLFPYIFTASSHMNFTLALSIPVWLSFSLYGWCKNTTHMFAHLVPQGAPSMLLPFLVLVESISNIIRPGTLAIRLTANMIAGHLLITLMSNYGSSLSIIFLQILILSQILLLILESAVSIIQAYVFAILMTLYSSEIQ
uniref:ATP synthase subunit a n=1 Tax=Ceutorhynchus albosuturalis TaxID=342699 RepID=A0AA51RGU1_9CUCU|nr:ATP synthase F0 subunit 6 [Ceutorhynchus albosuturalis]